MSNRYDNVRIQHKREISADWAAASGFVPLDGELIIYKADDENPVPRLKIGNGVDNVNNLEFFTGDYSNLPVIKGEGESSVKIDASYEGVNNAANGAGSVAMGGGTVSKSDGAHTEGILTTAGRLTQAETVDTNKVISTIGPAATEIGMDFATAADIQAATLGLGGFGAHAEGMNTQALGSGAHAEGSNTIAFANSSHAEGDATVAKGQVAHAEGWNTKATGNQSHAEGSSTTAEGNEAHAEGKNTNASGQGSHTEGNNTEATGRAAHAEGEYTAASGNLSHAEGGGDEKSGKTEAPGWCSHAEGWVTKAQGDYSHAEGYHTKAAGNASHAAGKGTIATRESQTVVGQYNVEMADALFVVGNGSSDTNRKNAFWVKADGTTSLDAKIASAGKRYYSTISTGGGALTSLTTGTYLVTDTGSLYVDDFNNYRDYFYNETGMSIGPGNIITVYVENPTGDPEYTRVCVESQDKTTVIRYFYSLDSADYEYGYNIASVTTTPKFSGSYNDLTDKPTIPSIEGLATEKYVDDKIAAAGGGGGDSKGCLFKELSTGPVDLFEIEDGSYLVTNTINYTLNYLDPNNEQQLTLSGEFYIGDTVNILTTYDESFSIHYSKIININQIDVNKNISLDYPDDDPNYRIGHITTYQLQSQLVPTDLEVKCPSGELSDIIPRDGIFIVTNMQDYPTVTFGNIYDGSLISEEPWIENYLPFEDNLLIIANTWEHDYGYSTTTYDLMYPDGGNIKLRIYDGNHYYEDYNSFKNEDKAIIKILNETKGVFSIKAGKYICGNSASLTWECWDKTLYHNGWNSGTINLNYGDIVSVETYSPEIDYHQINIRVRSNMYDVNADSVTSYSFFTDPASDSFYEGNTVETYVRLPEITSADNGKILQVVDGQLQLVSLPAAEEANF